MFMDGVDLGVTQGETLLSTVDDGTPGSRFLRQAYSNARFDMLRASVSARIRVPWGGDDPLADGCGYALGSTGKLLRPLFLLESAAAVGGDIEQAMPAAIAAESGHVASLVHDDIIDKDEFRRGLPSVPARYGSDD